MKKKLISLIACCLLFMTNAFATEIDSYDNVVYISPLTASAGTQVQLAICMKNTAQIRGFQFSLFLPEGVTAAKTPKGRIIADLVSDRLDEEDEHEMTISEHEDGSLLFLCSSQYDECFLGNDGAVATLTVNISQDIALGDHAVIMKNIKLSETDISVFYTVEELESTITIEGAAPKTELLETATTVPEATARDVELIVHRTIKANEWSTICLPFSMTEAQTKAVFGEDVQVCDFVDYEVGENSAGDITNITVNFEDFDLATYGFEANHPYLIKVADPISEFEVTAKIEPDEENAVIEYDNGKTGSRREVYGTFYGTLHAGVTIPANGLFISGNNFWYSTGSTSIKAFRGYFDFVDVLSAVEGAGIKMNWNINGDPTAIDVIDGEYVSGDVYSLQGIYIGRNIDKRQLPKGIYIVGGKKVLVK